MEEKIEISWSLSALKMLAELDEYIREESETAADNYIVGLHESLSKLEKHPESCAPCRNKKLSVKGF